MRMIIMLDPLGVVIRDSATIERHLHYGSILSGIDRNYKLLILTAGFDYSKTFGLARSQTIVNVTRKPSRFPLLFSLRALRFLRNMDVSAIVIGDPWESYLAFRIFETLARKFIPLQVQIHAEITRKEWHQKSWIKLIRSYIANFALMRSDSIRVVSYSQMKSLKITYPLLSNKLFVAHPPLNLDFDLIPPYSASRKQAIGFVGRIQSDRGLKEFVSAVKKLSDYNSGLEIMVAGDGPQLHGFRSNLESIVSGEKLHFFGALDTSALQRYWSQVGVLFSTSPSESYGRTIREALVSGVPVMALESTGIRELLLEAPEGSVTVFNLSDSASELSKLYSNALQFQIPNSYKNQMRLKQDSEVKKLCKSWIKIC